jgi:hypothetical protein
MSPRKKTIGQDTKPSAKARDAKARDAKTRVADRLWQRIQATRVEEDASTGADDNEASLQALHDVSSAVFVLLEQEQEAQEPAVAASFAPIHARLMDAIQTTPRHATASRLSSRRRARARLVRTRRIIALRQHALRAALERCAGGWSTPWLRWATPVLLMALAGWGGHWLGSTRAEADVLPAQSLLDDYAGNLQHPAPLEGKANDAPATAAWLSRRTGMKVRVPAPQRAGVKLLGGRSHHLHGHAVAQTRYLKNGKRVALYQIHAPSYGLSNLAAVKLDGRTFFLRDTGTYRLIAWRSGESVMALVTPFAPADALRLASVIRASTSPEMQPA